MSVTKTSSLLAFWCVLAVQVWAGGGGLNVVVVVNQQSTNSVQVGNYYCELRQVPPQNLLRINWTGGNGSWSEADFTTTLYNPLLAMLSTRQLTNQIDDLVLCMDLPYMVDLGANGINSTTSALFYGVKPDPNPPCSMASGSTNLYAGSESIFRSTPPISAFSNSFLVTMITSSNLAFAQQIIQSGAFSDSTFPTQTVYLEKSSDVDRNVRYLLFDNTIFNTRLRGYPAMQRNNAGGIGGFGTIFGAETGTFYYPVSGVAFVPGSLADNLTSYGGLIFVDSGHLNILSLLQAGAAGTYGTVTEPCNYLEKFPSPQLYFYQARGYTLAECYYQSVTNPYQGLIMGDPLAAPFAQPAHGAWHNLPANALVSGTTNLSLLFNASDRSHPIQQVDLFIDGVWFQSLTNIPPRQNNVLFVTLRGQTMSYTVSAGETIASVTVGLVKALNDTAYSNTTKVSAFAHGDRIELQSSDRSIAGSQVSISASNWLGVASAALTFVSSNESNFLETVAYGRHTLVVNDSTTYPPGVGAWLLLTATKTNGAIVQVGVTNSASGTTIPILVSNLVNAINATAALAGADGCTAEDFIDYSLHSDPPALGTEFNLRANSPGWNAAQLTVALAGSAPDFVISPAGTQALQDNFADLEPRAHLYVTAGVTNLPLTFALNTSALADGFHQLTAVAYEGSHVRTQAPCTQFVQVQNGGLSATFTTLVGGTNAALEANLQFSVTANTGNLSRIDLFSTGGLLASSTNQSSASFSVPGAFLGVGLHPFYALVTATSGQQYRTETKWIRIAGADSPFLISLTYPPPILAWPAVAGRSYDVLKTTNLASPFQVQGTLTPSNNAARWTDTNGPGSQRFYRVRTAP
jgi:uncharacterized protein (TIGR03790 family)